MDESGRIGRRELVLGTAAGFACAGLGSLGSVAAAQSVRARKLVIVLNSGGWDTTYALDPKPGASAIDAPEGEVTRFADLQVLTHASRPSVSEFFTRYAGQTAVVNGLQVRSFVHPDCLKRVLTGSPSETTPDVCAITAFELGRDLPVPYLALGGQARSGPYAAIAGRTGTTNQLSALLNPLASYPAPGRLGVPATGLVPTAEERGLVRRYLEATAERLRVTRGARGYNRARVEDYLASLDRAERLRDFAQQGDVGERDYTLDLAVQIPLSVRALSQGLSWTALMQTNNWDTHQQNDRQSLLHENLFAALITLVEALESAALLDETLVVVLSEMGRTPRKNADDGKDHWPVTSALLLGAGVRGGRVLGGTSDELAALSIDLGTGMPDSTGKQLQAANFVAGVLQAVGVDPEAYVPGVEPFRAFMS